jgi:hypothetical protein
MKSPVFWLENLQARVECKFFLDIAPEIEIRRGPGRHVDCDDQFIVWYSSCSENLLL